MFDSHRNSASKILNPFILSLLVFTGICLLFSVTAHAETQVSESSSTIQGSGYYIWNEGDNNYYSHQNTITSYLTVAGNSYMRVDANKYYSNGKIYIFYYDADFNYKYLKTIKAELPLWGAFYESENNYYIVSGQENPKESDSKEVYRVTKYDKNWKRLGAYSIRGANTYTPFDAGNCRLAMVGDYMFMYTCHTMYASGDGIHHQSSIAFMIDTTTMTEGPDSMGLYASHSFNQFVKSDGTDVVFLDHDDGYPRGIRLCKIMYKSPAEGELEYSDADNTMIMSTPGETGNNYTGISVGGLEASPSHYLVAGNSAFKSGLKEKNLYNDTRNIYLALVDKETLEVKLTWLTDLAEGKPSQTTPFLVKINDDRFMVLWTSGSSTVKYTFVDGAGKKIGTTYSFKGHLSDCMPLVTSDKITWYTSDNTVEKFYSISISDPEKISVKTLKYVWPTKGESFKVKGHKYTIISAKNATVSFAKAKNTRTVTVPATVTIKGRTYKVVRINSKAFTGKKIRTVKFGKNVKVIKKNAFKKSKATKLILSTKLLKKASVKGCLNGSVIKTVRVKIGSKKDNKKYVRLYKKIFTKKNVSRKVKVK